MWQSIRDFQWITPVCPLVHDITTPTIAVRPEWALRARLPLGVVDRLLMRTAYDLIGHDDRLGVMILHELEDLACNSRICPDVAFLAEPTLQSTGLGPVCVQYSNRSFARPCVVGAVERDRCDWIPTKATASFLLQG